MRWSEDEDGIVSAIYPDYALMARRLPARSPRALRHRAATLGVVHRRHVWTQREVGTLSRLAAAGASGAELARAFPHLRPAQVLAKMGHLARTGQLPLSRRMLRLANFDEPAIDAVRRRAIEKGLSLRDLDRSARTGRYFQKSTRQLVLRHVAGAAALLGGEVRFEWDGSDSPAR